jgi:hypothetical protein
MDEIEGARRGEGRVGKVKIVGMKGGVVVRWRPPKKGDDGDRKPRYEDDIRPRGVPPHVEEPLFPIYQTRRA